MDQASNAYRPREQLVIPGVEPPRDFTQSNVEIREAKVIAGTCVRNGCETTAADGSSYCQSHHEDQLAYQRRNAAKRRARYARDGLCIRCGGKRSPGKKQCAACVIATGHVARRCIRPHGEKAQRIAARTKSAVETCNGPTSGYERRRYRGQERRGRLSQSQENRTDMDEIARCLERAREGLEYCETDEVKNLPRIQRQEAREAAMSWLALAIRHGYSMCRRNRYPIPEEHVEEDEDEE